MAGPVMTRMRRIGRQFSYPHPFWFTGTNRPDPAAGYAGNGLAKPEKISGTSFVRDVRIIVSALRTLFVLFGF